MQPPAFWNNPPDRPGWQARALLAPSRRSTRSPDGTAAGARRSVLPRLGSGRLRGQHQRGRHGQDADGHRAGRAAARRRVAEPHVVSRGLRRAARGAGQGRPRAARGGGRGRRTASPVRLRAGLDRARPGRGRRAAEAAGAATILLDDGFQNPAVAKDLSLVVVDAETGFGNGRVLPAGPLREPVEAGLARADVVLSSAMRRRGVRSARDGAGGPVPDPDRALEPLRTGMDWAGLRALRLRRNRPAREVLPRRCAGLAPSRAERPARRSPAADGGAHEADGGEARGARRATRDDGKGRGAAARVLPPEGPDRCRCGFASTTPAASTPRWGGCSGRPSFRASRRGSPRTPRSSCSSTSRR
jgi:tetraacyldisaccharide 4'-kinase